MSLQWFRSKNVRLGLPVQFADSLFRLDGFADLCEFFACYGELASLFGRTGNFAASHWDR